VVVVSVKVVVVDVETVVGMVVVVPVTVAVANVAVVAAYGEVWRNFRGRRSKILALPVQARDR